MSAPGTVPKTNGSHPPIPLVEMALAIAATGIPVFPCGADKKPLTERGFKNASTDPDGIRRWFRNPGAKLIGIPTGERSGVDVVDLDPRHGSDIWREANIANLPETRIHETGGGGEHWVLQHHDGVRNSAGKIAPGIDVRGEGGYAIWPGSPGYTVISDAEPAPWPPWLLTQVLRKEKPKTERPTFTPKQRTDQLEKRHQGYVNKLLDNVRAAPDGQKHDVLLRNARSMGGILQAAGFSESDAHAWLIGALPASVEDWPAAEATATDGLRHGMLDPFNLEDRPRSNGSNGKQHAPMPDTETLEVPPDPEPDVADVMDVRSGGDQRPEPPPPESAEPAATKAKKKKRAVVNALALVNYIEATWPAVIRINLFTENMTVSEPFPPDGAKPGKRRQFREPSDQLEAMLYFQNNGFPRAGKGVTMDALLSVGHRNAFHPVADYLASLKWDGEKRLAKLFHTYFNAEIPTDAQEGKKKLAYLAHTGQCFMVSAVARIRVPGCKVDHLPVLVGDQGFNKSRAIRALCRDEAWFSDDLSPDLVDKDTKDSLVGKWLIELAEIPHVRKEALVRCRYDLAHASHGVMTSKAATTVPGREYRHRRAVRRAGGQRNRAADSVIINQQPSSHNIRRGHAHHNACLGNPWRC